MFGLAFDFWICDAGMELPPARLATTPLSLSETLTTRSGICIPCSLLGRRSHCCRPGTESCQGQHSIPYRPCRPKKTGEPGFDPAEFDAPYLLTVGPGYFNHEVICGFVDTDVPPRAHPGKMRYPPKREHCDRPVKPHPSSGWIASNEPSGQRIH